MSARMRAVVLDAPGPVDQLEIREAHTYVESGAATGKLVVVPRDEGGRR